MMYAQNYSADDLFDTFANQAHAPRLVHQATDAIAADLRELAPDMEDAEDVARSLQKTAAAQRLHRNT